MRWRHPRVAKSKRGKGIVDGCQPGNNLAMGNCPLCGIIGSYLARFPFAHRSSVLDRISPSAVLGHNQPSRSRSLCAMLRFNFYIQKMGAEGKMRKLFVLGFAFGAAALTTPAIFGCGDKLTLLVGSARLRQIYSRAHPASVLAYVRQDSPASVAVKELELRHDLKQAGYRFYLVENTSKLDSA